MMRRLINRRWVILALALVTTARAALADEPTPGYPEAVIQWGVQRGETCEDIAKAAYGDARHAHLLLRYNRIVCTRGAPLKPGVTLVIPAKVTTIPTATLRAFTPAVRTRAPGADWSDASSGMALSTNSSVNTLEKARADIQFIDRTRVFLAENTLVVIFGTASQTAVSKTPPPVAQVESGEIQAAIAALRGEPVEIAVPDGGRVSATSRDTVVERKATRTTVAVFDGTARVKNAGRSVDVPTNFGTRFVGAAPPQKPRPLPPAPVWEARPSAIVLAPPGNATFSASWAAVDKARAYRVELARDEVFTDLVARQEVGAEARAFRAERLPPGRYFLRVRAIDNEDFLGVAAAPISVLVSEAAFEGGAGGVGGDEIVASSYAVLKLGLPPGTELAVDDEPFVSGAKEIDLLALRPKKITLRAPGAARSLLVRYLPATASVRAEPAGADGLVVRVVLEGAGGVDVARRIRPRLAVLRKGVAAAELVSLKAEPRSPMSFVARISGARDVSRLVVEDFAGEPLGSNVPASREAERRAPPAEEPIPVIGLHSPAFAPNPHVADWWAPTAPGTGNVALAIEAPFSGASPDAQGRVQVSGALGPVSLEGAFLTDDLRSPREANESAWLGARFRFVRVGRSALEVGAAARLGIAVGEGSGPLEGATGLALGGADGMVTWLVDFLFDVDDGEAAYPYLPSFVGGATLEPLPWLRAFATVDVFGAEIRGEPRAGAGLTVGAEAGTFVYGGAAARVAPLDSPLGGVTTTLSLGVRP
ncbi:MAG: FecR domain-containing protein [Myxococcales bacterium]|nr:FecR domain-containing protein [Myxococcales bacterium]